VEGRRRLEVLQQRLQVSQVDQQEGDLIAQLQVSDDAEGLLWW
jgi:hypothetical protein